MKPTTFAPLHFLVLIPHTQIYVVHPYNNELLDGLTWNNKRGFGSNLDIYIGKVVEATLHCCFNPPKSSDCQRRAQKDFGGNNDMVDSPTSQNTRYIVPSPLFAYFL
jgi:hypothetical protein